MKIIVPLVNSIGLFFDIIGAILVASEVVRQFRGIKNKPILNLWGVDSQQPEQTEEYDNWERRKYLHMKLGLYSLLFGFLLQIISNWIPILFPITTQTASQEQTTTLRIGH